MQFLAKKYDVLRQKKELRFVPTETISKPFLGTYACTITFDGREGEGGGNPKCHTNARTKMPRMGRAVQHI